jgi:hypothetical protein
MTIYFVLNAMFCFIPVSIGLGKGMVLRQCETLDFGIFVFRERRNILIFLLEFEPKNNSASIPEINLSVK